MAYAVVKRAKVRQVLSPWMPKGAERVYEFEACSACKRNYGFRSGVPKRCKKKCPNNVARVPVLHITEGDCPPVAVAGPDLGRYRYVIVGVDWLKVNATPVYDYLAVAIVVGEVKYSEDDDTIHF